MIESVRKVFRDEAHLARQAFGEALIWSGMLDG